MLTNTKPEKSGAGPISAIPVVEVISAVIPAAGKCGQHLTLYSFSWILMEQVCPGPAYSYDPGISEPRVHPGPGVYPHCQYGKGF